MALPVFGQNPAINRLFKQGIEQAKNQHYLDAMNSFLGVLDQNPKHEDSKQYLWVIAKKLSDNKASLEEARVQRESWAEQARLRLALREKKRRQIVRQLRQAFAKAKKEGRPEALLEATETVEGLLQQDPELSAIKSLKAESDFSAILAGLEKATSQMGFVEKKHLYAAQGYLAYFRGEWAQALEFWALAVKEGTGDEGLRGISHRLGRSIEQRRRLAEIAHLAASAEAFYQSGLYADAVSAWRKVQELDPSYPDIGRRIGEALRLQLEQERQEKVQGHIRQGIVLFKRGNALEAAQNWIDALGLDPHNREARNWLKLAGSRLKMERKRTPPETIPAPRSADYTQVKELYRQGLIFYSEGETEKARESFEEVLKQDPKYVQARRALERIAGEEPVLP